MAAVDITERYISINFDDNLILLESNYDLLNICSFTIEDIEVEINEEDIEVEINEEENIYYYHIPLNQFTDCNQLQKLLKGKFSQDCIEYFEFVIGDLSPQINCFMQNMDKLVYEDCKIKEPECKDCCYNNPCFINSLIYQIKYENSKEKPDMEIIDAAYKILNDICKCSISDCKNDNFYDEGKISKMITFTIIEDEN